MSYHCKYCGKSHAKPETGRECHRLHMEQQRKAADKSRPAIDQVLTGRYLVKEPTSAHDYLVEVSIPAQGRWSSSVFMNVYDGSGMKEAVPDPKSREYLAARIVHRGMKAGMLEYGKETGRCPVCDLDLMEGQERIGGYHMRSGSDCYMRLNQ